MADALEACLRDHVLPGTRRSYISAVSRFENFVSRRGGGGAFPADGVWVAAWVLFMALSVSVASLRCYLSALRYEQGRRGMPWTLQGNELVRRAMRYVSRRYGDARKSMKFPVTLEVLRRILPQLPGWPSLRSMCHDDRVFAAASVVAVLGFLRGGEFLFSKGSDRPVLTVSDIVLQHKHGVDMIVVSVRAPKARWWLETESVVCLAPSSAPLLDPVWLVRGMRNLAPVSSGPLDPAFPREDGLPVSKQWMLQKTRRLLELAGICFPDHLGARVDVGAASWRAGGACTAKRAGVSDATICHMGRWASNSFLKYTTAVELSELRDAVDQMGRPQGEGALLARVGRALPAAEEEGPPIDQVVRAGVLRLRAGARQASGPRAYPPFLSSPVARRASG